MALHPAGIGFEGRKEFTVDSVGRLGKRDGHYAATETKYGFESTPSQFVQIEAGMLGSKHDIGGMTDSAGRNQAAIAGGSLAVERTSNNPLSITLAEHFTPKIFVVAAWNAQVWGREVGTPSGLNLSGCQRHRARLKFAYEF